MFINQVSRYRRLTSYAYITTLQDMQSVIALALISPSSIACNTMSAMRDDTMSAMGDDTVSAPAMREDSSANIFQEQNKPSHYDLSLSALSTFLSQSTEGPIVLVTSGGTSVPLGTLLRVLLY